MARRTAAFAAMAASGRYPAFARLLAEIGEFDLDFDDLFERGLAALLDGFAAQIEWASRQRRRRARGRRRR